MVLSVVSPCGPPSTFLLVVGASGLCTPGPMRLDGVPCPSALFLLRGIRRAAPAQVTACRVVTQPPTPPTPVGSTIIVASQLTRGRGSRGGRACDRGGHGFPYSVSPLFRRGLL